jgi:tetratricopeptide (TPR) repeat protein
MDFTKPWRGYGYLIFFAFVLLSGCASKSPKKVKTKIPEDTPRMDVAPIERIANPYLTQKVKVPNGANEAFQKAVVLMQGENWAQAEKVLQPMTQTYPEMAGPWVNLGIVLWRQNKLEEAEKAFDRALQINPLHNDAYVQYAMMLREQGQFERAEKLYQKALEVWPHNLPALRNLGILYDMYMGKFEQALVQYELALRVMPEPSREMEGWIIDLKRRISEQP